MGLILRTLLATLITIFSDFLIKLAADSNSKLLLLSGILTYIFNAFLWFWVYKIGQFSTVGTVYSVFTILFSACIGVLYFHESLGLKEVLGVCFGVISLFLLSKFL